MSENKVWCPIFTPTFREQLLWWAKKDSTKINKILDLIEAICSQPFQGIGKPEPLKYIDSNIWSRRINLEHLLVYRIKDNRIYFLQCRYHYES
ncbi:MAG: Txe/YoeB family addiction module toxin [Waterburya sp.]